MKLPIVALACGALAWAQHGPPTSVVLRGVPQQLVCYPGDRGAIDILFAPGDGGWRGLAIRMAQTMAAWGYGVCSIDTPKYLSGFTGKGATLSEAQIALDVEQLAREVGQGRRLTLVGWSEGAALMAVAAAQRPNRNSLKGVALLGLPEKGILGWRLLDATTWITGRDPDEPKFAVEPHLSKISPLPLAMIHSTGDQYTSMKRALGMFGQAGEPKRWVQVAARNHRFEGNQDDFFRHLKEALAWIDNATK